MHYGVQGVHDAEKLQCAVSSQMIYLGRRQSSMVLLQCLSLLPKLILRFREARRVEDVFSHWSEFPHQHGQDIRPHRKEDEEVPKSSQR